MDVDGLPWTLADTPLESPRGPDVVHAASAANPPVDPAERVPDLANVVAHLRRDA
jgi:hypothetical protein